MDAPYFKLDIFGYTGGAGEGGLYAELECVEYGYEHQSEKLDERPICEKHHFFVRKDIVDALRASLAKAEERVKELEESARWRKWPEEKPTIYGIYTVVLDDGEEDLIETWEYSEHLDWTMDAEICRLKWWRPITPPE